MWDRIKAHLVDDWHRAYRFLSVQLAVLLVLLEGAYAYLPDITSYLPEHTRGFVAGAIILARIIQQTKRAKP
jgi:hypothetical protein